LVSLLLISVGTAAQDNRCPAIVKQGLDATDQVCANTGRNQACYGNVAVDFEPQPDVTDIRFEAPGDIVDVASVRLMQLSPMDADTGIWGVGLMKLQANLPDTLPGQNVMVLLFGDVEIENAAETAQPILLDVTATKTINMRSGPSTNDAVVASLTNGQTVTADSRNAASDWLHIQLVENQAGWVYAPLVTAEGDVNTLPVFTAEDTKSALTTMQAFYFKSGIGDAPCAEAPESGMLIQTPVGDTQIKITVNEVVIALGSTAFFQAQPGDQMAINVLEGQAVVSAFDTTMVVPAGSRTTVPLNADGVADGPPTWPEGYAAEVVDMLPVSSLDHGITVPHP